MSKHRNYNKMYTSGNSETKNDDLIVEIEQPEIPAEEPTIVEEPAVIETPVIEEETVTEEPAVEEQPIIEESKAVIGVVINCDRLNVRAHPETSAEVLNIINKGAEVQVIEGIENDKWVHVCTATGIDGFCMKQYISVKG